jgi:hypothetical protein
MNTIGKILVILNFLFAIIVGVLLIMVFAAHNRWKDRYYTLEKEALAQSGVVTTTGSSVEKIVSDYKKMQQELEADRLRFKTYEDDWKAIESGLKIDIATLNQKNLEKDRSLDIANTLSKRQAAEIATLNKTIEARQLFIVQVEAQLKQARGSAASFEQMYRDMKLKNEVLLDQVREVNQALVRAQAGVDPGKTAMIKPNQPNRPAVEIEGKITKVLDNLVQISLGTDHGIKENNTLDVYRLQPEATYLGMIRITDAYHHTSVGRFTPANTAVRAPQLKEGDVVSSKIR